MHKRTVNDVQYISSLSFINLSCLRCVMETPPPTDTKAEVQPKDFVTATLPINPESTELLFAGQATINCGSGDEERGVTC